MKYVLWITLVALIIASTVVTLDAMQQPVKIIEKVETEEVIKYETLVGQEFEITAYCACEVCCGQWADGITKTGTEVTQGRTVAVDPSIIPLGSKVIIEGYNTVFIAEDTGNPKYISGKRVDIFFEYHDEALKFGREERKIWVLKND